MVSLYVRELYKHSLPSAASKFDRLTDYAVLIFPEIIISYNGDTELGFKLPNVHINRNARPFVLFMFGQLRKLIFYRLMITSLFHVIYLSRFLS